MRIMWSIEDMAKAAGGYTGENDVIAAWDYLVLSVPTVGENSEPVIGENEVDNTAGSNEQEINSVTMIDRIN